MTYRLVNTGIPVLLLLLMVAMNAMSRLVVPFEWLFGVICLVLLCRPDVFSHTSCKDIIRQPLFVLVGFILLQSLWLEQPSAPSKLFTVLAQLTLSGVILWVLPRLLVAPSSLWLKRFALALMAGYAVTLVEGLADFPFYRLLSGREGIIALHQLKWIETILFLFTFPVVYGCVREKCWGYIGVLGVLLGAMLWVSDTQSIHVACIVAVLVVPLGVIYGKTVFRLTVVLLVGLALAMPFAAQYVYHHYADAIHKTPLIGFREGNGAQRLEIYDAVADKIVQRPWLGYGVDAARHMEDFFTQRRFYESPIVYHPHNFLLQFWLDLGLFGMGIALWVVAWVFYTISRMRDPLLRTFSLSAAAAGFSIAFVGYGVWQSWWIATLVLTAVLFLVVGRMPSRYTSSLGDEAL